MIFECLELIVIYICGLPLFFFAGSLDIIELVDDLARLETEAVLAVFDAVAALFDAA